MGECTCQHYTVLVQLCHPAMKWHCEYCNVPPEAPSPSCDHINRTLEIFIVNCSKCTFCEDDKDSTDHILWQCSCIKRFGQILETLSKLNAKCNISFQARMTSNLVLFGLDSDNSVILFAKHYIYQCKRNMSLPRVDIFQKQLQLRYKVEEYNAKIISRDTFILYKSWCNNEALFSE